MPPETVRLRHLSLSRLTGLAGLVLLLASCATQKPLPGPVDGEAWRARQQALRALEHWQARGRIAVRTDDEGWSAGFDWTQAGGNYRIRLRGPFGQGALELEGGAQGVWVRRAGQPARFTTRPEILLERETGWRLPVAGLDHWLRGLPDNRGEAVLQRDAAGRLASLQQHGWAIDYRKYRDYNGYSLPARLDLRRDGLRIKVIVDRWELP